MKNESLVSISDFTKEEILELLEDMKYFEKNPNRRLLDGKVEQLYFLSLLRGLALVLKLQ